MSYKNNLNSDSRNEGKSMQISTEMISKTHRNAVLDDLQKEYTRRTRGSTNKVFILSKIVD